MQIQKKIGNTQKNYGFLPHDCKNKKKINFFLDFPPLPSPALVTLGALAAGGGWRRLLLKQLLLFQIMQLMLQLRLLLPQLLLAVAVTVLSYA